MRQAANFRLCCVPCVRSLPLDSLSIFERTAAEQAITRGLFWSQLYIKGEFVGGSDILMGLHQSGDLKSLLADGPDAPDAK